MAGKVTLSEVKSGAADLLDILKLNSLLDFERAQQFAVTKKKGGRA